MKRDDALAWYQIVSGKKTNPHVLRQFSKTTSTLGAVAEAMTVGGGWWWLAVTAIVMKYILLHILSFRFDLWTTDIYFMMP